MSKIRFRDRLTDWNPLEPAPAKRLAGLRILVGLFTLWYLVPRWDMFRKICYTDPIQFQPIGLVRLLYAPLPPEIGIDLFVATLVGAVLFTFGFLHRQASPIFALLLLFVMTYRNSWSMIYHSHNLVVLHTLILALVPAADAWSLDAWLRKNGSKRESKRAHLPDQSAWIYGWALWIICAITVITYALAGVAKLCGPLGWSWALGEALRDQVAVDAIRKEILGSKTNDVAHVLYSHVYLFTIVGIGTLVLELGAPLVLFRRKLIPFWVAACYAMHWGIYFIMGITFRYQLLGIVFASFLPLERVISAFSNRLGTRTVVDHETKPPDVQATLPVTPHSKVNKWLFAVLVAGIVSLVIVTFAPRPQSPSRSQETRIAKMQSDRLSANRIQPFIDDGVNYLTNACGSNGRFIYRTFLDSDRVDLANYNLLRHAGAIYSLTQYQQRQPDDNVQAVILRATEYFRKSIEPVGHDDTCLAVFSPADDNQKQAKLGGTGLGLVALVNTETLFPGTIPTEQLRQLGNFILFMQKSDGSFYSKYFPHRGGRDDTWMSLYYPGEAALGLLLLYELDPDSKWTDAALNSLLYLADLRKNDNAVPADHWALLATRHLLRSADTSADQRRHLLAHAEQICTVILSDQVLTDRSSHIHGGFTSDGRTTPAATRLEGLIAVQEFLSPRFRVEVREAVRSGIEFLLRAQIDQGPRKGGIPRSIKRFEAPRTQAERAANRRAGEIRIDYVQHAISAAMQFLDMK